MRQVSHVTELTDVSGAFGSGDSILVGDRVRQRGVRDDDVPALARWEMEPRLPEGGVSPRRHYRESVLQRRALVRQGADFHPRP